MKTLLVNIIIFVFGLFTCNCLVGIVNADDCRCWRYHEFGGCHPYVCDPDGDPNDPGTTWRDGSNVLPAWCEDADDADDVCSETNVSGTCAWGEVYGDEDCTDYQSDFIVTYTGPNATSGSTSCY